jgi:hypothetical protein
MAGSVNAALLLCQLIYWTGKEASRDGWIYKSREELKDETGLSRWEQEAARRLLIQRGLLEQRFARFEHRMYFKIRLPELRRAWQGSGGDLSGDEPAAPPRSEVALPPSRRMYSHLPESGFTAVAEVALPPSLNSNTETTTESTAQTTTTTTTTPPAFHAAEDGGSSDGGELAESSSGGSPARSFQDPLLLKALDEAHIREPARSRLAGLPHVTPELVAFHTETAPNIPTAIHRIEHDWPIQTKASQAPDGDPQPDLHDKAVRMLLKVSKLSAIPPGQLARIAQVAAMIARYGAKPTRRELVEQRESWLETEGRNGQLYSPLNFGWVDWADAELAARIPGQKG